MYKKVKQYLYINKVRAKVLLMAALLLAGCTADDETSVQQEDTLQLSAYTRFYEDITRGVHDGYTPFTPDDVTSIGIFMTPSDDGSTPALGFFSYNGYSWRSNIKVKSPYYYIYGFMPGDIVDKSKCSITPLSNDYANGAVITLDGLKPISKTDVCVIVGVQGVGENSTDTEKDVKLGQFIYNIRDKGDNFVNLLMDHIYSCVQFKMKVDADYAQLRTIKLKRMELKSATISSTKAVITLTANTSDVNPVTKLEWSTPTSGEGMSMVLFEDEKGKALSDTGELVLSGNLMPNCSDNLTLLSVYDVYDRKGNLVRKDCEATNKLPSSLVLSSLKAGERQPINLTVAPTYIYVLSDPDLDNPTLTFN